jgi:hypothetical protein
MAIKTKGKRIVLGKKKLDAVHDLFHLLEQFKYATSAYCMHRDREHCHQLAEKIKDNLEEVLL